MHPFNFCPSIYAHSWTIKWLLDAGASVTVCTHLGRPQGVPDPAFSVEPVRAKLAELVPEVALLDNLRFDPGETANDPAFVAKLIEGHDVYVNDAFGASHRAHASVVGPPQYLPSAAGRLLHREVAALNVVAIEVSGAAGRSQYSGVQMSAAGRPVCS